MNPASPRTPIRRGDPAGCLILLVLMLTTGCTQDALPLDTATEHLLTAREALEQGDQARALRALNASITAGPSSWAYFERAQLHLKAGNEDQAKADVDAGLQLDPEHRELQWLREQLNRPASLRFRGRGGQSPRANK